MRCGCRNGYADVRRVSIQRRHSYMAGWKCWPLVDPVASLNRCSRFKPSCLSAWSLTAPAPLPYFLYAQLSGVVLNVPDLRRGTHWPDVASGRSGSAGISPAITITTVNIRPIMRKSHHGRRRVSASYRIRPLERGGGVSQRREVRAELLDRAAVPVRRRLHHHRP